MALPRISARVSPQLHADCARVARARGYGSVSAWVAAVLAREVQLLDWAVRLDPNPTPPSGALRAMVREAGLGESGGTGVDPGQAGVDPHPTPPFGTRAPTTLPPESDDDPDQFTTQPGSKP